MPKPGPRTTYKYSDSFKAMAVKLSHAKGVEVQDVARSLHIHPFMLSRWRKEMREGKIIGKNLKTDKKITAELKELRKMKRDYARLEEENELLKKAIEFTSTQRQKSLDLSRAAKKPIR